jgi:serine/threonine-protein kinase
VDSSASQSVAAPAPKAVTPRPPAKDSKRREVRDTRQVVADRVPAAAATGTVTIAVSPWGEVEVDGRKVGTTPPLSQLTLSEGTHTITVRNEDFPVYRTTVQVQPAQPVTLRHRFGS